MKRLATSPQVAAFVLQDFAVLSTVEPIESTPLEGSQRGDVLEVSSVGPDGTREVVREIPLGKTYGNRRSRRTALSDAKRSLRAAR